MGVPVTGPGTTTLARRARWAHLVGYAGASAFVAPFAKEFGYTPGLAQERRRGLRV